MVGEESIGILYRHPRGFKFERNRVAALLVLCTTYRDDHWCYPIWIVCCLKVIRYMVFCERERKMEKLHLFPLLRDPILMLQYMRLSDPIIDVVHVTNYTN